MISKIYRFKTQNLSNEDAVLAVTCKWKFSPKATKLDPLKISLWV